jgi:uncharacterized DUF497 family protein
MQIEFDPAKDASNLDKHGLSLAMAAGLDWDASLVKNYVQNFQDI